MNIKNLLLILVLLTTLCQVYSQDYDLIVTTNGDSIACRIDSITDTNIYFEMKSKEYWKHTHINRVDVIEFKYNVINKKTFVFKPGTSIIEKIKKPIPTSMYDIQKNSISLDNTYIFYISVFYERIFPLNNLYSITIRGGYGQTIAASYLGEQSFSYLHGETTLLAGGPKHILELGFSIWHDPYDKSSPVTIPVGRIGYRLQGYDGILLRVAFIITYNIALPTLSIGFSF